MVNRKKVVHCECDSKLKMRINAKMAYKNMRKERHGGVRETKIKKARWTHIMYLCATQSNIRNKLQSNGRQTRFKKLL